MGSVSYCPYRFWTISWPIGWPPAEQQGSQGGGATSKNCIFMAVGRFFFCNPDCPKKPRTSFLFYKLFYLIITAKFSAYRTTTNYSGPKEIKPSIVAEATLDVRHLRNWASQPVWSTLLLKGKRKSINSLKWGRFMKAISINVILAWKGLAK